MKNNRVVRKFQFLNSFLIKIVFLQGFARKNAGLLRGPTGFPNKSNIKIPDRDIKGLNVA